MAKTLEINAKHVADAIRRLAENSERELESIVAYGAKQMAKKAQRGFNRAEYDGTNDVTVSSFKTVPNAKALFTYAVMAYSPSGSVAFIEFGAGQEANLSAQDNPFRLTVIPTIAQIGQYRGQFHPFDNDYVSKGWGEWWVYKSDYYPKKPTKNWGIVDFNTDNPRYGYNWTKGNKPARAMWGAKLEFDKKFPEWVITVGGKTK